MNVKKPDKSIANGLKLILEFLRDEQYNYRLENTSELFLGKSDKEIADLHAGIDWIYTMIQKVES